MSYTESTVECSKLDANKIKLILEEISRYDIELVPDPTLPQYGNKYIQECLAKCRAYLNRVQYYYQMSKTFEKNIKSQLRLAELDYDLKISQKLADDEFVRRQPSIEDRKALAASMLRDEITGMAELKVQLLDVEESVKIIKMKYEHLKGTAQDIKLQRNLVKDDNLNKWNTGTGYEPPDYSNITSPFGVAAPITPNVIDPSDILDPTKRPEDFPEPVDATHANQIAEFYSRHAQPKRKVSKADDEKIIKAIDLILGDD